MSSSPHVDPLLNTYQRYLLLALARSGGLLGAGVFFLTLYVAQGSEGHPVWTLVFHFGALLFLSLATGGFLGVYMGVRSQNPKAATKNTSAIVLLERLEALMHGKADPHPPKKKTPSSQEAMEALLREHSQGAATLPSWVLEESREALLGLYHQLEGTTPDEFLMLLAAIPGRHADIFAGIDELTQSVLKTSPVSAATVDELIVYMQYASPDTLEAAMVSPTERMRLVGRHSYILGYSGNALDQATLVLLERAEPAVREIYFTLLEDESHRLEPLTITDYKRLLKTARLLADSPESAASGE